MTLLHEKVWLTPHPQCTATASSFRCNGMLTPTMYTQYSFLSGVQVCSPPQCTVSSFLSGVQVCSHPHCTVTASSFLSGVQVCSHPQCTASSFLSGVQVCSNPQCNCKASKVSPLKYGCAYTQTHPQHMARYGTTLRCIYFLIY